MISRLTYRLVLLALVGFAVSIYPVGADTLLDQTNTSFPFGDQLFQNAAAFAPMGQSFTPTLTSLNFVNLLTQSGTGSSAPFTLELNVRSGSISGTALGTSQLTTVTPPQFAAVVTPFAFSGPVELVPGDLYVIEIVEISGEGLIGSTDANNYPGGTQILGGVAQPNNDLWFQEGIRTPEPGVLLFLAVGLAGLAVPLGVRVANVSPQRGRKNMATLISPAGGFRSWTVKRVDSVQSRRHCAQPHSKHFSERERASGRDVSKQSNSQSELPARSVSNAQLSSYGLPLFEHEKQTRRKVPVPL
jgi:hypothetical protein